MALMVSIVTSAAAMTFNEAREHAMFLTDKMSYEFKKTSYFYRPMSHSRQVWSFSIYEYYTDKKHMYTKRPNSYKNYKGAGNQRKNYSPPARPLAGKEMRKQQKNNPHSNSRHR